MVKTGLIPGVRVVELGAGISAAYCGKVLAGLGAEVIKVEPPGGDETRRMGPFPGDTPHPEKSGLFLALNACKYGVTLDLTSNAEVRRLAALASSAEIVIISQKDRPNEDQLLDYSKLRQRNPQVVLVSVTPFGRWGPYADFKATDLTLFHMSGHAHDLLGPVDDPEAEPPIRAGGHQAELVAGMAAATAALMALYRKRTTGLGCHLTVSSYEAMVTQAIAGLADCAYGRPTRPRSRNQQSEATARGVANTVTGVLPCSDGYVAISPREDAQWERWLELMGDPPWAADERFATRTARESNLAELWELMSLWSRQRSKFEVAHGGQELRIPCFPVNTVQDLMSDDHLEEREFFLEIDHPLAGTFKYPGAAYRLSNTSLPLDARPAPLLGQHNRQILNSLSLVHE